jgi:hypothetical protein
MKKKLAAAAVAAGVIGLFAVAGPDAHAACNGPRDDSSSSNTTIPLGADDAYLYTHSNGAPTDVTSGGYVGVSGNTGYIEAGSPGAPTAGYIAGATNDGSVSGSLTTGGVCVNDVKAP